jgi:predicted dehydrogenase
VQNPTKARVVAVCEPRPYRLAKVADESNVSEEHRFSDWRPLAALGRKIADAVVIAILDGEHAECVEVFAKLGYAILCEKVSC